MVNNTTTGGGNNVINNNNNGTTTSQYGVGGHSDHYASRHLDLHADD
jgi:hypothetical protein